MTLQEAPLSPRPVPCYVLVECCSTVVQIIQTNHLLAWGEVNLPHRYLAPPLGGGLPLWDFMEIFGIRKLEFLDYHTALFACS